jgi:DnaA family protein
MPTDVAQLALPVTLRDEATLENFLFGEALGALSGALLRQTTPAGDASLYVHGPAGSGRSHLLQAACHAMPPGESLYLPLDTLRDEEAAAVLAGVEGLARVCLDDLQAIAGHADWEMSLFHMMNRCLDTGCRLLFSADRPPRELLLSLPDLASRLSGATVFRLAGASDARKLAILLFRAKRRGINLSEEAGRYILSRAPRGLAQLMQILDRLDRDSLAAGRPLTVPFIKERLGW